MNRMWTARFALVGVAAGGALVAGCGGGSGDAGGEAPAPLVAAMDVAAAWRNTNMANQRWSVSGRGSDGRNYVITLQSRPLGEASFAFTGQRAQAVQQVGSFRQVEANTELTTTLTNYVDAAGNLVGVRYDDGTCETVSQPAMALPTRSPVGSSGALVTSVEYDGCAASSARRVGSSSFSWSVQQEGGVLLFCVDGRHADVAGALSSTDQQCLEAGADGTLGTRARISVDWPGRLQLVAKNY